MPVSHKEPCESCREKGGDTKGDNLIVYHDGGKRCFACGYVKLSEAYLNGEVEVNSNEVTVEDIRKLNEGKITEEQMENVKSISGLDKSGYRGIREDTYKLFRVRTEFSEEDGSPIRHYYPYIYTAEGEKPGITGYKVRDLTEKRFYGIGSFGSASELFGQFRFRNSTRTLLITAGEVDTLSAYQMLRDYQVKGGKEDFEPVAVVSSVAGEGETKQFKRHYQWINQFDKIVVGLDNDEAGKEGAKLLCECLPKGKVFIATWDMKDPNEMLQAGKERQFIDNFFRAKQYTPAGIVTSADLYEKVLERASLPKIPLPPFLSVLEEMMAGGILLRSIINIYAKTGYGKTTIVNEMLYYWIYHSPYKPGVVTLELDAAQYGEVLLSRRVGRNLGRFKDVNEKIEFLKSEEVKEKAQDLYFKEDSSPRWYLVDEREGDIESVKRLIEDLVISCNCQLVILDPLQDLLEGLDNEQQGLFMKWQKSLIKNYPVTIININHMNKGDKDGEDGVHGSSSIVKSGWANIELKRDKKAETEDERNTTKVISDKIRWTGESGDAGMIYYDGSEHRLYDYEEYFTKIKPNRGSNIS